MSSLIRKTEEVAEQRMVWAEVFAPNRPDSGGDFMTVETIRKMAYEFVRKGRLTQVDTMHNNKTTAGVEIVETFIAREDDQTFIPGAWVVGCHVNNDELWAKVQKGELNGFSLEALALTEDCEVDVDIPPVLTGKTSMSLKKGDAAGEDHEHTFFVAYNPETAEFLGGKTDVVKGHSHLIRAGTVTDEVEGHSHRFSSVDDIEITGIV